jgi:hypothetical protein
MNGKTEWLWMVMVALVSGLAGSGLMTQYLLKAPLERLSLVTPVFVLDRARLIQALPPNASPEQMIQVVDSWKTQANKLSAAGYLVLDSTAIVAAPDDMYVSKEGR